MKPRFGLIRAKEFIMKDMYTFDGSDKAARYTYERVSESYAAVLKRLRLEYVKGISFIYKQLGSLSPIRSYHRR